MTAVVRRLLVPGVDLQVALIGVLLLARVYFVILTTPIAVVVIS